LLFRLFQPVFTVLLYMFSKSEVRPYTRTFDVTILSFVSNIFDLIAYRIGISQVLYYAKCENANFCKKKCRNNRSIADWTELLARAIAGFCAHDPTPIPC